MRSLQNQYNNASQNIGGQTCETGTLTTNAILGDCNTGNIITGTGLNASYGQGYITTPNIVYYPQYYSNNPLTSETYMTLRKVENGYILTKNNKEYILESPEMISKFLEESK
jgi:hypothetical protein